MNNAGNFNAGFFEEITPEDFRAQIETTLFGPINVTRAVLPVMQAQGSGLVVAISSTAGIVGQEFCTAYSASKFGLEGWIESLTPEIAPYGIRTMLVEPGFFRTELLTPESTRFAAPSIVDYAERTKQTVATWKSSLRLTIPRAAPTRFVVFRPSRHLDGDTVIGSLGREPSQVPFSPASHPGNRTEERSAGFDRSRGH